MQQLEGSDWGPPDFASYVVATCHALRRKPLEQYTVEDLRLMIGQGIGLAYLVPVALEVLERDPLASGDYYRGDLLKNVLSVEPAFWREHLELWAGLMGVVQSVETIFDTYTEQVAPALAAFKTIRP